MRRRHDVIDVHGQLPDAGSTPGLSAADERLLTLSGFLAATLINWDYIYIYIYMYVHSWRRARLACCLLFIFIIIQLFFDGRPSLCRRLRRSYRGNGLLAIHCRKPRYSTIECTSIHWSYRLLPILYRTWLAFNVITMSKRIKYRDCCVLYVWYFACQWRHWKSLHFLGMLTSLRLSICLVALLAWNWTYYERVMSAYYACNICKRPQSHSRIWQDKLD